MSDLNQTDPQDGLLDDPLTGHEYDGIREYDNPIPGWWTWMFVGSCVFALLYYGAYQLGTAGTSVAQAYEKEVTANLLLQFKDIGTLSADEPTILKYMNDDNWLLFGKNTFAQNCVSCHGKSGEGLVGPNLTDNQFKNVTQLGDVGTVIRNGAANGAMPAWNNRLHPNEIVMVAAYVASLRGQNLTGPRGPEGETLAPWPEAPRSDAPAP